MTALIILILLIALGVLGYFVPYHSDHDINENQKEAAANLDTETIVSYDPSKIELPCRMMIINNNIYHLAESYLGAERLGPYPLAENVRNFRIQQNDNNLYYHNAHSRTMAH